MKRWKVMNNNLGFYLDLFTRRYGLSVTRFDEISLVKFLELLTISNPLLEKVVRYLGQLFQMAKYWWKFCCFKWPNIECF